jgi:hypothetical protein
MRKWLKKYGIGIDCSGFVQQALKRLIKTSSAELRQIANRKTKPDIPFLRCLWVYKSVTATKNSERIFKQVLTPVQARPGDVLVNRNHMRIAMNIEAVEDDGVIFELVESTSAGDIPSGKTREEPDIGPRIIHVKYMKSNWPISKQTPLWKRSHESTFKEDRAESTYVIGRYRELDQLWGDT